MRVIWPKARHCLSRYFEGAHYSVACGASWRTSSLGSSSVVYSKLYRVEATSLDGLRCLYPIKDGYRMAFV